MHYVYFRILYVYCRIVNKFYKNFLILISFPLKYFLVYGYLRDAEEVHDIMALGRSRKKEQMVRAPFDLDAPSNNARVVEFPCIGMYGNGLKSGSMRIADDMLLATVQKGVVTFLLLSRTFLDRENLNDIPVPMPSYDAGSLEPYFIRDEPTPRPANDPELIHDQQLVGS